MTHYETPSYEITFLRLSQNCTGSTYLVLPEDCRAMMLLKAKNVENVNQL